MSTNTGELAWLERSPSRVPAALPRPGNRLLVPLIRGQSAASLLTIGDAIAHHCTSSGVVLSLVEIPARWSGAVASAVVRSRELLRWIAECDYEPGNGGYERLSIQSRFTTDASASIREALLETQCDAVLAEWPSDGGRRRHRLEAVLQKLTNNPAINLIVARPDPAANGGGIRPSSVLVPLRGGANARLALSVAAALGAHTHAQLTLMHVYARNNHHELRKYEEATFRKLVEAAEPAHPRILELVAESPAEVVLRVGRQYDAVVMGAHSNPGRAGLLVGADLSLAMNELPKTVILARAATPPEEAA